MNRRPIYHDYARWTAEGSVSTCAKASDVCTMTAGISFRSAPNESLPDISCQFAVRPLNKTKRRAGAQRLQRNNRLHVELPTLRRKLIIVADAPDFACKMRQREFELASEL